MNRTNNYLTLISGEIIQARRNTGAQSPQQFAEAYLQYHCNLPFSRMHEEIFFLLKEITERRDGRVAIAAPRGYAKSTIISLAYPLWCVLYGKESFVLVVSNTSDQAISRLNDIKRQLEINPLLLSDFPEICGSKKPTPWRRNRILLANGAMISAYGGEQELRGVKKGKDRPGLIICDDLENLEQVREEQQREKLKLDIEKSKTLSERQVRIFDIKIMEKEAELKERLQRVEAAQAEKSKLSFPSPTEVVVGALEVAANPEGLISPEQSES